MFPPPLPMVFSLTSSAAQRVRRQPNPTLSPEIGRERKKF
jgi:hypothetical protein